jgi:hypothetical protein
VVFYVKDCGERVKVVSSWKKERLGRHMGLTRHRRNKGRLVQVQACSTADGSRGSIRLKLGMEKPAQFTHQGNFLSEHF